MRKIGIIILTTLFMACGQPDDSLSGDFVLDSGGGILIPFKGAVSSPAFSSPDEFWTAEESDMRVLEKYSLDGVRVDRLNLYTSPAPDRIGAIDISYDGQTAFFSMIDENDLTTNDIGTLQFGSNDHDAFLLNSAVNYILANPANVYCTSLDYNNGTEIVYLGNYYDTGLGTVDQSIYVYELGVGLTATVPVTQNLGYNSDMTVQGGAASWVDGRVDDSGKVSELAVALKDERTDGTVSIFKVFGTDGSENFDSTGSYEFQDIGGLQWFGEESMVLCVKLDGRWKIVKGNSSGELYTLYTAGSDVYSMEGLDLSPGGDRCITRVLYDESGERNDILVLSLN